MYLRQQTTRMGMINVMYLACGNYLMQKGHLFVIAAYTPHDYR